MENKNRDKNIYIIVKTIIVFLSIIFFIITEKIFYLSIIKYKPLNNKANDDFLDLKLNDRSNIIDRNGKIIATNLKVADLYVIKKLIFDTEDVAKKLAMVLDLDETALYNKITQSKLKRILIKKDLFLKEEEFVKKLPLDCLYFEKHNKRYYLYDNLFSSAVGFINEDTGDKLGLEKYYDDYLSMGINPLKLTLDVNIQSILRDELLKAQEKYKSNFVFGVITEVKTGNILAVVDIPDYNPNVYAERMNGFSNAIQGLFEFGSVLKIFTIASGLENKVVGVDTVFDVDKTIQNDIYTIKEGEQIKKKKITLAEAFALSSNIAAMEIAEKVGIKKYIDFLDSVGLMEKLNIDIGYIQIPKQQRIWNKATLKSVSYGYGLSLSALHLIQGANAILNNGEFVSLRFAYLNDNQVKRTVISQETSKTMRDFFRLNTTTGTGRQAYIENYDIGGKTGTANKAENKKYSKRHLATFVSAFPMENPQYSILISIDNPKSSSGEDLGSSVPASITKNVILKLISVLD